MCVSKTACAEGGYRCAFLESSTDPAGERGGRAAMAMGLQRSGCGLRVEL